MQAVQAGQTQVFKNKQKKIKRHQSIAVYFNDVRPLSHSVKVMTVSQAQQLLTSGGQQIMVNFFISKAISFSQHRQGILTYNTITKYLYIGSDARWYTDNSISGTKYPKHSGITGFTFVCTSGKSLYIG